jgi:predicted acylesterase/phospholipase RssA
LRFSSSPRAIAGVGPSAGYRWIFARGIDHNAYSRIFVPNVSSPGGRWQAFQIMGGLVPIGSQITCGISSGGFKFAFARRTNNRIIVCPAAPTILRWDRWFDFAGEARGDVTTANYSDGRVVVFVVGMDYAVWCRAQTDPMVNSWRDWERLDGILTSNVAAARDADEVLTIFARGLDKAIWYNRASSATGFTAADTNWVSLGTPSGIEFNTDPVVHQLSNSMLAVFAVGNDKKLYINIQTSTGDTVTYAGWHKIGGNLWTGIELRLATVSVESGDLRHVDESGRFCESMETPPGVPDAIIASASIPAIFPAVPMNGQAWVDGGVRSVIPIQGAISAGAQLVYAISCSPNTLVDPEHQPPHSLIGSLQNVVRHEFHTDDFWSFPETLASWSEASIPEIGLRAIDMLPHSILQLELTPYQPWPVPVIIIQPSFSVHDALQIDSALIRISEAYGWMRAYEATVLWDPVPAMRSSDAITLKRRQIWFAEGSFLRSLLEAACRGYVPTEREERGFDEAFTLADDLRSTITRREFTAASCISQLRGIRTLKHELDALVRERREQGFELPPGAENWWRGWERPRITTTCSPRGYESRGGPWDSWTITAHGGRSFSIEEEII